MVLWDLLLAIFWTKAKVLGAELVPTDRARRDEHPVPSTT